MWLIRTEKTYIRNLPLFPFQEQDFLFPRFISSRNSWKNTYEVNELIEEIYNITLPAEKNKDSQKQKVSWYKEEQWKKTKFIDSNEYSNTIGPPIWKCEHKRYIVYWENTRTQLNGVSYINPFHTRENYPPCQKRPTIRSLVFLQVTIRRHVNK